MKKILNLLLLLTTSFFIASCNKDPYPDDGNLRVTERAPDEDVTIALPIVLPEQVTISEGRSFIQKIVVAVPAPGLPIVEVENLPAGAVFDQDALTINWTPSFKDGNDAKDPTIKERRYDVTVRLFSTEDGTTSSGKDKIMTIIVKDVPQRFEIDAANSEEVDEGDTLTYNFKIENEDYPQGPFNIYSSDIPANAKIERIDTNNFKLVYSPDFHHVKLNENAVRCSDYPYDTECFIYKGKITAINPANHKIEKEIKIIVRDRRQNVELSVPKSMVGGLDISFSVSAIDPNGEIAPNIKYNGAEPKFGDFKTHLVKDTDNKLSVLYVTWNDIPPTYNGTVRDFSFKSCVLSDQNYTRRCENKSFSVGIRVKDRKPPVFSRNSWKTGEIKYLNYDQKFKASVRVRDGDNTFLNVNRVEVLPKSMQKYIKFQNGRVVVSGVKKPGLHQFTLSAISEYNVSSAESFVFEVFDEKRSQILYFTDSTRDAEVAFYRDTMKNVELMNPALQVLNERNLSGRKTLILGTGILADPERAGDIEQAMKKIENVVIATPLIENMPQSFLQELQRDFRVSITGRYSDINGAPDLSKMYFVARSDLQAPKGKIRLKLDTTDESLDPLIFSVGVDRKNCQDVLDFTDKGKESLFKIGVICDRLNGGRYVILGTEFADLKTKSLFDKGIPAKWLETMLTTDLNNGSL